MEIARIFPTCDTQQSLEMKVYCLLIYDAHHLFFMKLFHTWEYCPARLSMNRISRGIVEINRLSQTHLLLNLVQNEHICSA